MNMRGLLAAGMGVLLSTGSAWGQGNEEACGAVGNLEVGHWAAYEFSGVPGQDVSSVRFAIVESEGEDFWYEFSAATSEGAVIVQLLVPGFPFQPADIRQVVMKAGDQPAMKLPSQMVSMMQQQMGPNPMLDFAKECASAKSLGRESVGVPAGTFDAWHLENVDERGNVWISSDVPFGVVKGTWKDGGEMALEAFGTDATSSITETPTEGFPGLPTGGPPSGNR